MKKVTMGSFLVRTLLLMIPIIGSVQISFAQKNKGKTKEVPAWIRMMDEPGVNYKQAVAEFEKFWEGRETPMEENELFETAGDEERERELRERKQKKLRKSDPAIIYALEYKRFKQWQFMMADFVKPDGTVKTMDEATSGARRSHSNIEGRSVSGAVSIAELFRLQCPLKDIWIAPSWRTAAPPHRASPLKLFSTTRNLFSPIESVTEHRGHAHHHA